MVFNPAVNPQNEAFVDPLSTLSHTAPLDILLDVVLGRTDNVHYRLVGDVHLNLPYNDKTSAQ
jgi:hypothetical protein